ncbi:MAG: c-type cytochrome [Pirellulaceae bacterium]
MIERCVLAGVTSFILAAWFCAVCPQVALAEENAAEENTAEENAAEDNVVGPLAPAETLKHFQLEDGLRIELVAAEPDVIDPVAVRFDEDGRMWVVEMRDYPHGPGEGQRPQSRIKILEDADGDGRFEKVTVFADHLLFVTGVQPWRGGAFVTLAGRVAYMKDVDGDGRADTDETWYTGFAQENSQLRANHPRVGIDGHVYIANGLRGGSVVDAKNPGEPLSISGMDFRFDPHTREFEAISGVGQFGLTFDEFGNRFTVSNRNPLKHIVLEDHYLKRNPRAAVRAVFHDVAASGEDSRLYPIAQAWTTSTQHAGQFTAACGVFVYRGEGLPGDLRHSGFTCDPTGSLVHREVMRPAGATFTSRPPREGVEFLASPDEWFRPVNLELGPEGALYVVDMYRAVIEHPQFMPEELKRRPDLRDGDDRGRIYRIVPTHGKPEPVEKLSHANNARLIALLDSPLAWRRETAARLLLERQDKSTAAALPSMAAKGEHPAARAQALWLLSALDALDIKTVEQALGDKSPRVRKQAVKLSEAFLQDGDKTATRGKVVALAADDDPRVRFQVALTLAPIRSGEVAALADIARRGADDPWTRRAVAIASSDYSAELLVAIVDSLQQSAKRPAAAELELVGELSELAGANLRDNQAESLLASLAGLSDQPAMRELLTTGLLGLARSSARRRSSLDALIASAERKETRTRLQAAVDRIAAVAADAKAAPARRIESIDLLGHVGAGGVLQTLAMSEAIVEVRRAALAALARTSAVEPWKKLAASLRAESPTIRGAILDGLLARTERTQFLLDEIAAGRVSIAEIDRVRTDRLLKHRDAKIRARSTELFADAIPADRQQVLADYQVTLKMKSDPTRGQAVFKKNCATCHRIGGIGVNVAPDIADSRTKTPAQILTDVLQPNRAIDANYVSYNVVDADGRVLNGLLTGETATSITLKQPEGKTVTLLRDEVEELRSSGVSLMPEGLEKNVSHQEMADLISFIKNWRYLDGRVPLGPADGERD